MSKDYIECRNCDSPYCNGCNVNTLSKMLHKGAFKRITDEHHSIIPVAEVVAVKHGRLERGDVDEWYTNYYTCMECGASMMLTDADCYHITPKFCANCGAKMRGDGE